MKLYQLAECYRNLLDIMEDSEVTKEMLEEGFSQLDGELEEKLTNMTYMVKELEAGEKALKEEEERLAARRKSMAKNRESLTQYMELNIRLMNKTRIKGEKFTWNIQKNPPKVVVDDLLEIPSEYIEIVTDSKIDKRRILELLKLGEKVGGCRLEQTEGLRIR